MAMQAIIACDELGSCSSESMLREEQCARLCPPPLARLEDLEMRTFLDGELGTAHPSLSRTRGSRECLLE
eukprot:CAMPEP_0178440260 /NCGR_PEP_ID=MMETSP0689_2-20121128/36661_1 /TAXON_ID=160604 /ORGANISM="Amphidinium massartii, Strain CS-259" /LENGTH=69 /DNA_ID=CAMNT_0020062977 /DNA_START=384 /DNA_END=593 /DNA_ORIENTATION=+